MTRIQHLIAIGILALAGASCHNPDAYLLSPDQAAREVGVALSKATLPADGVSRSVITATLDGRTAPSSRKVTFKTTLGTLFAGGTKGAQAVTVDLDASGTAVAELQSETTVGTARVEVIAGATSGPTVARIVDVPFTALAPDDAFTLSATPTSIPADGFSRASIRAVLVGAPGPTLRTVTFTALSTGLLFAGGESAGALTRTVTANSDGVATVELQSSRNLEIARIQATALGVTRDTQVTFTAAMPSDVIRVSPSSTTLAADGASIVRVVATIAAGLPSERRGVRFTTSLGTFGNDTKTIDIVADGGNRATADLRSEQTTGVANVRATLIQDGVSDASIVQFVPALPDRIFVTADSARVDRTQTVGVHAQLLRDVGKPTEKTQVVYSAVTVGGAPVGGFSSVSLSDASGASTATFTPGPSAAAGLVTIRATVSGTLVGSTVVEVF